MSLLDRAIACSGIPDHRPQSHVPCLPYPSINRRRSFYAKVKLEDDEQVAQTPHKGFSIKVPTIPKLGDIESARCLLESAFQALSFDMPKLPDVALQGFPLAITKLSVPMRVLVLDMAGFVVTKLKKPQTKVLEELSVDENQYPRCAWPRTTIGGQLAGGANIEVSADTMIQEAVNQTNVGAHCAWPRTDAHQSAIASGPPAFPSVVVADPKRFLMTEEAAISPSVIEGGARCAWPRKSVSARQSFNAIEGSPKTENQDVTQHTGGISGDRLLSAECKEAAELPRRMLATSVGLTVMNQLVKGSIVPSILDFCSLLPAGTLETPEEEEVAMDIGRQTLLVFIKGSSD